MGVIFEAGYALPSGDEPLTHARIAHAKNWLTGGTITASATATDYLAASADNSMTYSKWKGRDAETFATPDNWTLTGATIATDAPTAPFTAQVYKLLETAVTSQHKAAENAASNWTADEFTYRIKAKSINGRDVRLALSHGGTTSRADFDLGTGTVSAETNATGQSVDLGNGWWQCILTCTPTAGAGALRVIMLDAGTDSYLGVVTSGIYLADVVAEQSVQTWEKDFEGRSVTADYCFIAGHGIGTEYAQLTVQKWNGSTWDDLITAQRITDDMPIFCIFAPVAGTKWRIQIDEGNPEIAVVRFGEAMQMEREVTGDHRPLELSRKTTMRTNKSNTGEFLGKTLQRVALETSFQWAVLTDTWVNANWPDFQRALEEEPFGIAWRPDDTSEVAYCDVDQVPAPNYMGADFMQVSVPVTARGYD